MKKIFLPVILFLMFSCHENGKVENATHFQKLISRLPVLQLPFHYDMVKQDNENCIKPLAEDSALFHGTDYIVGILPDTIGNYKIIYLATGDDFYLCLKIVDRAEKIIDDNLICFPDAAGADCDFDSCRSFVDIEKNKITRKLFLTTTDCDSVGNKIIGTTKHLDKTETITVDKQGHILIGK